MKNIKIAEADWIISSLSPLNINVNIRQAMISESHPDILLHKPHPQKELKSYQVKQLLEILEQEGLI